MVWLLPQLVRITCYLWFHPTFHNIKIVCKMKLYFWKKKSLKKLVYRTSIKNCKDAKCWTKHRLQFLAFVYHGNKPENINALWMVISVIVNLFGRIYTQTASTSWYDELLKTFRWLEIGTRTTAKYLKYYFFYRQVGRYF